MAKAPRKRPASKAKKTAPKSTGASPTDQKPSAIVNRKISAETKKNIQATIARAKVAAKATTSKKPETAELPRERATERPPYSARQFFIDDYARTLFPLATNRILVEAGEATLRAYFDSLIETGHAFLPQKRAYAAKDALHLRRTVKLDPVAEFFIYDLIFRNRAIFRKPHVEGREHFGYRFEDGRPIPGSRSYKAFKAAVWEANVISFAYFIGFDIASYFNHVYHHDLVEWFAARGASEKDTEAFGKFLRETNSGRTLDCLPQGLYPSKMIGNDFLRFVEESHSLHADAIVRFMDDFYIFSNNEDVLKSDFAEIQRLLGQKGLSVNAGKTTTLQPRTEKADSDVGDLKKKLLERRRKIVSSGLYDDDDDDDDFFDDEEDREDQDLLLNLSAEELDYITTLLQDATLEEDDAELILTVMRKHTEDVEAHLPEMMRRFPHLAKNVARFCAEISDKELVAEIVLNLVSDASPVGEYQLFWFGVMLEEYLINTRKASKLIDALFNHPNATDISRAKVLEIPDQRFGLQELRNSYLGTGQSDWLSWSSAVGSRSMGKAARNYRLTYFKNSSPMNRLIGDIVESIDATHVELPPASG
jgi:hypothetical protein